MLLKPNFNPRACRPFLPCLYLLFVSSHFSFHVRHPSYQLFYHLHCHFCISSLRFLSFFLSCSSSELSALLSSSLSLLYLFSSFPLIFPFMFVIRAISSSIIFTVTSVSLLP